MADRKSIGVPLELGGNTNFWEEHDILAPLKEVLENLKNNTYDKTLSNVGDNNLDNDLVNQGIDLSNLNMIVIGFLIMFFIVWFTRRTRKLNLEEYNKKHKKKFQTYGDLEEHLDKEKEKRLLNEEEGDGDGDGQSDNGEGEASDDVDALAQQEEKSSSDLGGSLKRLKKMYNNGSLSKAEFEKAKNKLLK
tara:strand:- start:3 stop:575 length:573 start_codon:yes stop_codon:yes gene_type:complete